VKSLSLSLKDLYPLIRQTLENGQEVYITIRGNSMSPFLFDGRDQAVFAPLPARAIRKGDIIFYQRKNGQFVMHRVYKVEKNGQMTLLGDAQWTLEKGIEPHQLRAFVPRAIRKGKEISCEKGFYHRLMTLWQFRIRFPRIAKLCLKCLHLAGKIRRLIAEKTT